MGSSTRLAKVASNFAFYGMIGRSPAMHELFNAIRRFAPHVRTVLVSGETGTGNELFGYQRGAFTRWRLNHAAKTKG